jgi:DNA cross-link repair 1A protein
LQGLIHFTIEIAKSLNSKIFVTDQKKAILDTFQDQELNDLLTDVPKEAQVHVIPLGHILPEVSILKEIKDAC